METASKYKEISMDVISTNAIKMKTEGYFKFIFTMILWVYKESQVGEDQIYMEITSKNYFEENSV